MNFDAAPILPEVLCNEPTVALVRLVLTAKQATFRQELR
jgi:hypothetical protein